jgi:hypothetical protein
MMTRTELLQAIAEVERLMPHNRLVMSICEDVKLKIMQAKAKEPPKSISQARPWEAEGMSRATWYRRRRVEARR